MATFDRENLSKVAQAQSAKLQSGMQNALKNPQNVGRLIKYSTNPMYRMGINSSFVGGLGIVGGLLDKEDDTVLSLLGKGVAAAAIEHATGEAVLMGAQAYMKHKGMPNFVTDPLLEKHNVPQQYRGVAKETINEATRRLTPGLSRGKLAVGGIGGALGLVYTLSNKDDEGVFGTAGNIIAGAGLGLMGREAFNYFSGDRRSVAQKTIDKFKASDEGKLVSSSVNRVMSTPEGKAFQGHLDKIFQTDAGKALLKDVQTLTGNDIVKVLGVNMDSFKGNADAIYKEVGKAFNTKEGQALMSRLGNISMTPEGKEILGDITKYTQTKVVKGLKDLEDQINNLGGQITKGLESGDRMVQAAGSASKKLNALLDGEMGKQMKSLYEHHGMNVDEVRGHINNTLKFVEDEGKKLQQGLNKFPDVKENISSKLHSTATRNQDEISKRVNAVTKQVSEQIDVFLNSDVFKNNFKGIIEEAGGNVDDLRKYANTVIKEVEKHGANAPEAVSKATKLFDDITAGKVSFNLDTETVEQVKNASTKKATVNHKQQNDVSKHATEADRLMREGRKWSGRSKFLLGGAAALIGIGTLADVGNNLEEKTEVAKMKKDQEKNLERRQIAETRMLRKDSHDYVDYGEIVTEMFNERIGHYKMGNSKFE